MQRWPNFDRNVARSCGLHVRDCDGSNAEPDASPQTRAFVLSCKWASAGRSKLAPSSAAGAFPCETGPVGDSAWAAAVPKTLSCGMAGQFGN